jgi:hypothetical protein
MAKGVIDSDVILNQAKPLVHQQAQESQPFGHMGEVAHRAGGERVQGRRGPSQPAACRYDHAARLVQEAPLASGTTDVLSTAFGRIRDDLLGTAIDTGRLR